MASDLHIAGVIRLHRFEVEIELVLKSLAQHCDGLYITTDAITPRIRKAIDATPKVRKVHELLQPWTQAGSLDAAFRLLDDTKPDVVLLPDEDELLPEKLPGIINDWTQVWGLRPSIRFPVLHCIGTPDRILSRRFYTHNYHCKVIRWSPGISYLDGYAGWCWPSSHYRQKKYTSPFPYRHMAYMTSAQRKVRCAATKHRQWFHREQFPTMQYSPEMTWDAWCAKVGPYTVELSLEEAQELKTVYDLLRLLRVARRPESIQVAIDRGEVRVCSRWVEQMHEPFTCETGDEIHVRFRNRVGLLRIRT